MTDVSDTKDYIPVQHFYNGKSVLVTGGLGFLGKILVEKLLRSCPGIQNIYLIVRFRKNINPNDRLEAALKTPVFDKLRISNPDVFKKIILITGDFTQPHLDIGKSDKAILINKVSIVFHIAASVRFNENIKHSVTINTVGTKYLAELCHQMSNIKAFVYVSTAFSNCELNEVQEQVYPPPCDIDKVIQLMELTDETTASALAPALMGKKPNTYTFTKALAENVLERESTRLPIAIVRPSIVLSTLKEPIPGWIDSYCGPTPFVAGGSRGFMYRVFGNGNNLSDLVPADMVINLTICAAWRIGTSLPKPEIEVIHCVSGQCNPVVWQKFNDDTLAWWLINPPEGLMLYPSYNLESNYILYRLQSFFLEIAPAYIFDAIFNIAGRTSNLIALHQKAMNLRMHIDFILKRQWTFADNNMLSLLNSLQEKDKKIFPFDIRDIHWKTYFMNYNLGIRHYLFKNDPNSLEKCRKRLRMLKWLNLYIPALLFTLTLYFTLLS